MGLYCICDVVCSSRNIISYYLILRNGCSAYVIRNQTCFQHRRVKNRNSSDDLSQKTVIIDIQVIPSTFWFDLMTGNVNEDRFEPGFEIVALYDLKKLLTILHVVDGRETLV